MSYKGLLFDLDGTLIDTIADLSDSMNHVLTGLGFPPHHETEYKSFVGSGIRNLARLALPETARDEATIESCYRRMVEHYSRNSLNKTKPYEGIEELLDTLKARGLSMSVLSNKADAETQRIIAALLPGYFDLVIGMRSEELKKPNPAMALQIADSMKLRPEEIVYVGDSDIDMLTACNAGMYAVGVLWGFRSREQLVQAGAATIVNHPAEIASLL